MPGIIAGQPPGHVRRPACPEDPPIWDGRRIARGTDYGGLNVPLPEVKGSRLPLASGHPQSESPSALRRSRRNTESRLCAVGYNRSRQQAM